MDTDPDSALNAFLSRIEDDRRFEPSPKLAAAWQRALRENAFLIQSRLTAEYQARVQERLADLGLSQVELNILAALRDGPLTPRRLQRQLDAPGVETWLEHMAQRRALSRSRSGPHTHVGLTVLGQSLLEAAVAERDKELAKCYSALTEMELYALLALLDRLRSSA